MWENIARGAIRYSRPRGFNIAGASAPVAPAVPTPLLHSYACACVLRLIPMLIRAKHTPAIIRVSAWPHRHHAARGYNTKFVVKRHDAVAPEALANRTVKKQRRRRTNVL